MLMDCDRRHLIKQCTRCKQAIPVEQWLQHTLKQVCKLKKGKIWLRKEKEKKRANLCYI